MLWIFLAITAHFFWALDNLGDKYILGNRIKDPYFYLIFSFIISAIVIVLAPFVKFYIPELKLTALIFMVAGIAILAFNYTRHSRKFFLRY